MTAALNNRESAENYRAVIVCQGRIRVILCRDGIQWIVQRRDRLAGGRWRAGGYFVTRKALSLAWTALEGTIPPEIARLPATVQGRANG